MSGHRGMRIAAVALLLVTACERAAWGQIVREGGAPSPFVKDYKVDFAIPDAPAFKLLEVDESAILRPQTVRDLSLAFDGFRGNNNTFVVPKQFGVEFSPGLLIGSGTLKLTDYTARKFLYALRFSGATSRDSLNRGQIAAGVRVNLVDEQDLRRAGAAEGDTVVTRITETMRDVYVAARRRVGPGAPLTLNADEKAAIAALSDSIKTYWADKHWNSTSIDVALAGKTRTADSLGHDPKLQEFAAWGTYANGLQGWGQVLVGAKLGVARDSAGNFKPTNALAARLYIGSNALKGFLETQQAVGSTTDAQWLVNSGVEVQIPSVGWINASLGLSAAPDGGRPRAVSSFKFKMGVPGT